jgi:hypothetical protein
MLIHSVALLAASPFLAADPAPGNELTEIRAEVFVPLALVDGLQELTIRDDGAATFRITSALPDEKTHERIREQKIVLSKEQLAAIKSNVDDARFFSLPESVGAMAYDTTMCTVTVKRGDKTRKVTIWRPFDPATASKDDLDREARAKKVWSAVWSVNTLMKDQSAKLPK